LNTWTDFIPQNKWIPYHSVAHPSYLNFHRQKSYITIVYIYI